MRRLRWRTLFLSVVAGAFLWISGSLHPVYGQVHFVDETATAGVADDLLGTGLCWGDYDGDGALDLYVTNTGASVMVAANALYRNNGDGTFEDIAKTAGVELSGYNCMSAIWGDYDNDGDLDLYVTNFWEPDVLYRNNGDDTFKNVAEEAGHVNVIKLGLETSAAWGDYDNDGDLDLYLCKHRFSNSLYRNNGDGTFTYMMGIAADPRDSEWAAWGDYDNDGDLDLYVINREQENALYRNDEGTFTEIAWKMGMDNVDVGKYAIWGDYDNDGLLDLFLGNIGANALYRNEDGNAFSEVAAAAGVRETGTGWIGAGAAWGDCDLDGDLDLYVANGEGSKDGEMNVLFVNDGEGKFEDRSEEAGLGSIRLHSAACGWGDTDNDGDLDLYVVNGHYPEREANFLYRNELNRPEAIATNFIRIIPKCAGRAEAIGARVTLFAGDAPMGCREISSGPNAMEALFGVDPSVEVEYWAEVRFPGTAEPVVGDALSSGATYVVDQASGTFEAK